MRPTPRAEDLARSVQSGLALIEAGLASEKTFDPSRSSAELRIHLTDIGEARFIPPLMREMRRVAPGIKLTTRSWPQQEIGNALDSGDIHLAIGFLPELTTSAHAKLLTDRYVVLVRAGHSAAVQAKLTQRKMQSLDWIAVRSHTQTLQMLQAANLDGKIKLTTSTFLALPAIVKNTDLAVLMPQAIAREFTPASRFRLLETELPSNDFTVSVHWSRRQGHTPLVQWGRSVLLGLLRSG